MMWARDTNTQESSPKGKTAGWVRIDVKDRITSEWFAIPLLAFASGIFQCNIAIWEPADGRKLRLYKNGYEV